MKPVAHVDADNTITLAGVPALELRSILMIAEAYRGRRLQEDAAVGDVEAIELHHVRLRAIKAIRTAVETAISTPPVVEVPVIEVPVARKPARVVEMRRPRGAKKGAAL